MLGRRAVAVVAAAAGLALIPMATPAAAHTRSFPKVFVSVLRGANEVPNGGDAEGVALEAPVDGVSHNCVDVDPALATDIADNPKDYYFNIHTTVFPAGALRAQLR
jgi:hypothetical protein